MINKKLLLTFFFIILALPLILAQTYKQNTELNLKIPFEVNGSTASSSAMCNISIDYPDGSYLKDNATMTNLNNGDFNITLLETELINLGYYDWRMFCCDGVKCAAGYDSFEITPSGNDAINSGEGMTLLLSIGSILIFAILLFIFSFKVSSFPAKVIFMGLSLTFFIVVLLFSMVSLGQILGGYSTLIDSYSSFFWVALFLFFLVFIFLMLCLLKRSIELFKVKRGHI